MRLTLMILTLIALTACGTPQERCIRQSTSELRRIDTLLGEVRANLARGYAWEEYTVTVPSWDVCGTRTYTKNGKQFEQPQMCIGDETVTRRRPVPIDPVVETRKRDNLLAKKAELSKLARSQIAQCRALYPEEKN
ncbi:hypothetical protein DL1_19140 [Thioclava dalianensis]|uniref:Uncharacterized protein n=1 Tax=Thioclava dalianensis TaxID=1185766 RepID=A0A074TJD2_9RHOB|nr:hypothetical protein [Thioclava dalianensis]KEP70235.1 hypothetical protein DL1_19140 [Thioclava dalianensis]SFM82580.1 hypothetical protein SAMN05216224_101486 [Thioclava dalianensis]